MLPTVGPITESVYASGVVKAGGQYMVYPTVNGTVTALLVKEGDTVKAGQPLLRIDDRTSGASSRSSAAQLRLLERNVREDGPALTQLREAVAQARDKLTVDSTNYERQRSLWSQRIGSQNDMDQRELAFNTSRAAYVRAVKALEENRERLRTELDVARNNAQISTASDEDRTPRSLIDGTVYDLLIEAGELATPQKPIAVIGSNQDLHLELDVDEYDITQVRTGLEVLATFNGYPGQVFKGTVVRIIPIMDERSRTFKVEAHLVEKPPTLYPNLTVEANIVLRKKENALTVPASYVIAGNYVLTAPDERTAVELGARDLEKVEVLKGIEANTPIYKP